VAAGDLAGYVGRRVVYGLLVLVVASIHEGGERERGRRVDRCVVGFRPSSPSPAPRGEGPGLVGPLSRSGDPALLLFLPLSSLSRGSLVFPRPLTGWVIGLDWTGWLLVSTPTIFRRKLGFQISGEAVTDCYRNDKTMMSQSHFTSELV